MARLGTFRSLRQRNAKLFFAGMLVSNCGTWMQSTAQGWLVYRLSGEGTSLGLVLACQFLPLLLLGPWAGVLADRMNRRRLTIATQAGMAAQAVLLGVLDLSGLVTLPLVYGLAVVLGVLSAIDNPARRSLVTELVDEEDIPNVLSLNTAVMTGSRVFGPALAALLVGLIGTGWCFMANGASFFAVLASLLLLDPAQLRTSVPAPRGGKPLREALRFVWRDPVLRSTFVILTIVSTFAFNYGVSLLLVASRNLGGGVAAFGLLLAVTSVGSFLGSLVIASQRHVGNAAMLGALTVLGVFSTLMAVAPNLAAAFVLAVPLGMGGAGYIASTNGILLPRVRPDMRGRVLALQATAFLGSTPIGGPITGWIGDHFGAGWSIAYGGLIVLACVAVAGGSIVSGRRSEPVALRATASGADLARPSATSRSAAAS
jgi:MFS family permease